jgi:hypothetical protein
MQTLKGIFFLALLIIFQQSSYAQIQQILQAVKPDKKFDGIPCVAKKSQVLQVGIGIPNNATTLLNGGGIFSSLLGGSGSTGTKSGTGPIFIGYEYFLKDEVSVGLSFTYASGKQDYNSASIPILGIGALNLGKAEINLFQIAASSSYHLYSTDKIDPYIKGAIGINLWKTSYTDNSGTKSDPFTAPTPFGYQGLIGLRYFAKPALAVYGEVGYSSLKFTANIGIAYKIK